MFAIFHKGILPTWGRIIVATKYALGFITFAFSTTAVALILTHTVTGISGTSYAFFWASLFAWLFVFSVSGWINSASDPAPTAKRGRYYGFRLFQTVAAVALCPLTATWTLTALVIVAAWGNSGKGKDNFNVIAKTRRAKKQKGATTDE